MSSSNPPSRGYRFRVVLREVVLWLGALAGIACLVMAAAAVCFGITPLVFRTGSMSPSIPTGALALAQKTPAADLRIGDVVSVIRADGQRVTHRLVSRSLRPDGRWSLVVKGDANAAPDQQPIVTRSVDRVFWSTPRLGFFLRDAAKPQYVFAIGAAFGILAAIGFRPPLDRRRLRTEEEGDVDDGHPHRGAPSDTGATPRIRGSVRGRHARPSRTGVPISVSALAEVLTRAVRAHPQRAQALVIAIAVTIAAGAVVGPPTKPTFAAFNDSGSASGSFSTSSVSAPDSFTCSVISLNQIRFSWTEPSSPWPPESFTLTNTSAGISTVISPGSARTVVVNAPLVSLGGLTQFVYTIQANSGATSAVAAQTRTVTAIATLLPTCN